MKRHIHAAVAAIFCLVLTVLAGTSSAQSHGRHLVRLYKATLLLDADTQTPFVATDLNNLGEVAGDAKRPTLDWPGQLPYQAAVWRQGQVTRLQEPDFPLGSGAGGLNDRGQVIGGVDESTVSWGALWTNGTLSHVGSIEGEFNFGLTGINNRGHIITGTGFDGVSYLVDGVQGTGWAVLGALPPAPNGVNSSADGLNFADDVVGSDFGPTGRRALLWRDDTVEMLGTLPGMTESEAKRINSFDRIVGFSRNSQTGLQRAFLWRNGRMRALPLIRRADDESSTAADINDWGQIVGNEKAAGSSLSRAVLWEHGRAFDLNALVRAADALQPHVTLFSAFRVNERGQILVAARDDRVGDIDVFYLLTPVFEWR
jgi:uncharacterized membrane protein